MYVNTGGGGKSQQQQPLQNQANVSVRHSNPYSQTHTPQQPHYEHHQGPVAYVYPFCNVAPATHANAGGNNVGVAGGQPGHMLFQATHQHQPQPHHTQQPVGLHNTEQTLHYFAKSAPMPAHQLHHPSQQHTQLRNMITTVNHQRQPYMLSPNYFALSHALLPQQTRAPILTNAAPQHALAAAAGGGAMATQLQNTAPRSVPPNGPPAYVTPPYCAPSLLLSAAPTAVAPQSGPMLTAAPGLVQPPSLQAYAQMGGVLPAAPTPSTPINLQHTGIPPAIPTNNDHNTNINITINTNTKQRKHAIPIIHPETMEIFDPLDDDAQPKPQPQPQPQQQLQPQVEAKIEVNMETVSIQTDTDKSAVSLASDLSDVAPPTTCSNSSLANETDKINVQIEHEDYDYDNVEQQTSDLVIEESAVVAAMPEANTKTQSVQSASESLKNCAYEDPNDTDADTNEHELDNEDLIDATDGNVLVACIEQDLPSNLSQEEQQQIDEVPKADVVLQAAESDTDHTTETEIKSKDEPHTISVQTSTDRNEDEMPQEIHEDLQASTTAFIVSESKKNKNNRKNAKNGERNQKNLKQQSNKSNNNNASIKKADSNTAANVNIKTAAANSGNKAVEPKNKKNNANLSKKEKVKPTLIRYTLEELKAFAKSPESRKTPVVPCQKGDCIAQLFVARPQHHHHLSHQGQNMGAGQHHVQQSYHQMNFGESIEMLTGKRRSVGGMGGGTGAIARKHQEHHMNFGSTGNNNSSLQAASGSAGVGSGNTAQLQKKMQLICINLSLNEEIKLSECKNAWQPKFLSNTFNNNSSSADAAKSDNDDLEDVLKKVRGILNKLTSENFDVLLKEMISININTAEKMQKVMLLIFEKTVSEPNFAPTYAKFCKVLFEEIKAESKEIFNDLLIKRLEKEFESNVNNADAKERKLQQIMKKLNDTTDPQEKIELQAELEHQEYQFRRRAWGTVRFIGEMFKLRSLSAGRVFICVESLLKHGNEEKLEYMCKLLTTVGHLLESNEAKIRMNKIFAKMQAIIKEAKEPGKKKVKICSRVRFMMQDLIDLRFKNWGQSSYAAPSSNLTLRRRLPEDKNSNIHSASSYDRGAGPRMSFGNNNRQHQSRSKESSGGGNSGNYYMQKSGKSQYLGQREQQSIDLKKLNFSHGDDSSSAKTILGTFSAYTWSVNTDRGASVSSNELLHNNDRVSPTSSHKYPQKHHQQTTQYWGSKNTNTNMTTKAILETCSSTESQQLLNHLVEEYLDCLPSHRTRWRDEVSYTWQNTNNKQQLCLVYYILMDYLHLAYVKRLERNACANIFVYLMNANILNKTTFIRAYEQFAAEFPDLLVDVPDGWTYVFQFLGPLLHERLLKFHDIWYPNWRSDQLFTERFVNALVVYFTKEFGANYMRELWHKEFKLESGAMFKSNQQNWRQFVSANKLQFLFDSKAKPEITLSNANDNSPAAIEQHVQRLEILLSSPNDSNLALDYINTNVNINSCFLQKLIRFLCCDYATTSRASSAATSKNSSTCSNTSSSSNPKHTDISNRVYLNMNVFRNNCLPLLRMCLDGHEDHELVCLDSIVEGVQQEYDPHTAYELICSIFDILYDREVIAKESFEKWHRLRLLEHKESKIQIKRQLTSYIQKLL